MNNPVHAFFISELFLVIYSQLFLTFLGCCVIGSLTRSVYDGPSALERTQALPSEGHVLLAERQTLRLQQLPPVLFSQDGVHRLQEVFPALRRAGGRTGGGGGGRSVIRSSAL